MQAASSFLNRKVLRRSLPSIKGKPPAGAPVLKRLLLDQGELAHFWDGDEPIRYMAFLELRAGALRGNHYHKNKREFFYLSSGKVLLRLLDPDTRASETLELNTGDLVDIAVGVAHAFEVLAEGHAVEFAPQKFDVEDVYACDVTTLVSG